MTSFDNCLTINECYWPNRLLAENDLVVFKCGNTLNAILVTT